jgi:hypothetical protein
MASVVLGLISAALFLLAAFHVPVASIDLGWLGGCFLALAIVVPPALVLRRAA